jgi:hypothetical protein
MVFTRAGLMNRFLPRRPGLVTRLLFLARISFSLSTLQSVAQTIAAPSPSLIDMTIEDGLSFRLGAHDKVLQTDRGRREGELIHQREQSS